MSRDVLAPTPLIKRYLYRSLFAISQIAPRNVILLIGYSASLLFWLIDKSGKQTVRKNLKTLLPDCNEQSLDRMVRKSYANFGIATAESLLIPRLKHRHFKDVRIIDPWQQFAEKPIKGPVIGVTVHCNWEIMPCILNRLGYIKHCHGIALSHGDREIDRIFTKLRESMGVHSLLLDRAPLETLRALKAGGVLALVGDRDYTQHGLLCTVGGGQMKIPVGPAALAIQTNAAIIPVFACRSSARQYSVIIAKPIRPDPALHKKQQLPQICNELAQTYERFLRCAPSQWVCFHPAFHEEAITDTNTDG